jgi:hypothetical protein
MALPILDGNQSATTLSSILTSGEHIPAHTVVSLGTQAITDISGAVSGSVVSISNFPATQTIAGTVTAIGQANGTTLSSLFPIGIDTLFSGVRPVADLYGYRVPVSLGDSSAVVSASLSDPLPAGTNQIGVVTIGAGTVTIGAGTAQIGSVTASISNSVTIGSLPTISGTVTANLAPQANGPIIEIDSPIPNDPKYATIVGGFDTGSGDSRALRLGSTGAIIVQELPAISGTVTVGNSVTIASFATSVTARLINPAGTAVTYAEVGTAGSPSIDVLSVQGVTAGSPVITTLLLSSTAITSGSFTSLASATLVPGNTARKMATVYNLGAGQLFVNAGATATTLGGGFMVALSSGDFYECDYTTTTLSAIFATAGTASWMSH